VPPPPITEENPYYRAIMEDPRYQTADGPKGNEFPKVEYLKKTIERTLPYWDKVIVPQIKASV
jgi:2,3-bisphosphoglycerate-dependent phosphoglycerate mutase